MKMNLLVCKLKNVSSIFDNLSRKWHNFWKPFNVTRRTAITQRKRR